ncbi:hypothetical protein VTN77DRAFT_1540 [Rasamsonia byssochlamydoides]|uniref:uncharacterized protein n=1 Tax=Rasamsonia byssochlamydoides TaxID=89139 RepID=UPI003743AEA1
MNMATKPPSSATAGAGAADNPLAPFMRLARNVYLREPTTTTPTDDADTAPQTIIIAFWFSAPPRALVKYVTEYARLAPSARIIFLLSTAADFWLYPTACTWAHRRRMRAAVGAIHSSITATATTGNSRKVEPGILMHIFSNGGVFTAAHLLLAYKHITGSAMPVSAMIIDSAPGRSTLARSAKALSFALPRTGLLRPLGMGVIYFVLIVSWLWRKITRAEDTDSLAFTWAALIDERLVCSGEGDGKKGTKRCYIYSDTDDLIPAAEVEEHAAESAAAGWPVEREKFLGSPHVGHMRADSERYWGIVKRYLREN